MADRFKTVLLFGSPGVGKGTQGAMLGAIPGLHHIASGDIFRSLDPESEIGKVFFSYSSKGELVPDEVTIDVWRDNVEGQIADGRFHPEHELMVLDGIPRNVNQASIMGQYIEVLRVIHLVCQDEDEMIARMSRRAIKQQRHDDAKPEVLRHRFNVYKNETSPVLAHYGPDLVTEVPAVGIPSRVLHDVLDVVVPLQEANFGNFLER